MQAVQGLVARGSDAEKPKVLTIGTIRGGDRGNLVAERVRMEGTLRTLDEATRADLKSRLTALVSGLAAAQGARGTVHFVGAGIPATVNDARLVRRLAPALRRELGSEAVVNSGAQMGSEDFAFIAGAFHPCTSASGFGRPGRLRWPVCTARLPVRRSRAAGGRASTGNAGVGGHPPVRTPKDVAPGVRLEASVWVS